MLSLLTNVIGGPLFGIVGSVITNVLGAYQEAQRQKREYAHIEKMTDMNAKFKAQEAEYELVSTQVESIGETISASYAHDASYGAVGQFAATLLRFVRPTLTFMLIGMVIYFFMDGEVGKPLIVEKTLFLSEMALTWWFVDRRIKGR